MPRATVLKSSPGRAVIMTEQCEFKEIKTDRLLQVGEEIEYDEPLTLWTGKKAVTALAVAACVVLLLFLTYRVIGYLPAKNIYACVDLEINPSLELGVNRSLRVLESKSFDQEANAILAAVDPEGKKLETVISSIVRQAKVEGYLREGDNVIGVGLAMFSEPEKSPQLLNGLEKCLQRELTTTQSQATVYYFLIDKNTRGKALKEQTSPIRYYLCQKAKKEGVSLPQGRVTLHDPVLAKVAAKNAAKVSRHLPASPAKTKTGRPGPSEGPNEPAGKNRQPATLKRQSVKNQGNSAHGSVARSKGFVSGSNLYPAGGFNKNIPNH